MEWLLLVLLAGGGGVAAKRWRAHTDRRRNRREELAGVRQLAEEDVTLLGEELQRLGWQAEGQELDEAKRIAYQSALDAYEAAKSAVPRMSQVEEISTVVDTLSTGRYGVACVQAAMNRTAVPERRVPCFFNPQHGPSVHEVLWTQPGRGTRSVPACAQDAARVRNHQVPDVRHVRVGELRVPYWEAGAAYQPYGEGYFAGAALMGWAFGAQSGAAALHWPGPEGLGGHEGMGGFDVGGGLDGGGAGGGGDGGF